MNLELKDILFIIFATIFLSAIFWDLIPDPFKKYFKYVRMVNRDRRKGRRRKYIFSFKNEVGYNK